MTTWDDYREKMIPKAGPHVLESESRHCLTYLGCGLVGEAGEVHALIAECDGMTDGLRQAVVNELGDTVWYLAAIEWRTGLRARWPNAVNAVSVETWLKSVALMAAVCSVAEQVKRPAMGRELQTEKLQAALDRVATHVSMVARAVGGSVEMVLAANEIKIAKRYGDRFTPERARELDEKARVQHEHAWKFGALTWAKYRYCECGAVEETLSDNMVISASAELVSVVRRKHNLTVPT